MKSQQQQQQQSEENFRGMRPRIWVEYIELPEYLRVLATPAGSELKPSRQSAPEADVAELDYYVLLRLKLFPLGSQAQLAFFQDDCAQQFKFHWRYGAHVRFQRQWRHAARGKWLHQCQGQLIPRSGCLRSTTRATSTTTTTMPENYTAAATSCVFAAGKAMRPIPMTLVNTGKFSCTLSLCSLLITPRESHSTKWRSRQRSHIRQQQQRQQQLSELNAPRAPEAMRAASNENAQPKYLIQWAQKAAQMTKASRWREGGGAGVGCKSAARHNLYNILGQLKSAVPRVGNIIRRTQH